MNFNTHTNAVELPMPYYTTNLCPVPRFHQRIYAPAALPVHRVTIRRPHGLSHSTQVTMGCYVEVIGLMEEQRTARVVALLKELGTRCNLPLPLGYLRVTGPSQPWQP